jgi:alkanesulfonate monooxygenase SsuD/methylene tetrahydromethanopterin reductase-like flavin-dependent oxidoreductase (luciferase family)
LTDFPRIIPHRKKAAVRRADIQQKCRAGRNRLCADTANDRSSLSVRLRSALHRRAVRHASEVLMEFGLQFFPAVGPDQKSAAQYWGEALHLTQVAERLGFTNVRTVEHYFHPYGGYSPDPLVFLSAAAAVTRTMRLVTGAVLPIFNHPLKLAGQIGMVDAISNGRLEVGLARAFLPHEFARFGISIDESLARFDEGLEQIRVLLEHEVASSTGKFHSFENITSLPRPTQKPRPPFWIAATTTKDSFAKAGRLGHWLMCIPMAGGQMAELIKSYRDAWVAAGHPGRGRVMMAFHMFCAETREKAVAIAREPLNIYLKSIVNAASDWMSGVASKDYPNYQKMIEGLSKETFETQVEKCAAWVGTPEDIRRSIASYAQAVGGFESASLQVNFGLIRQEDAEQSMSLFAREVIPHFRN